MVDFGSEQGLSDFETAGIAGYVEDSAEASLRAQKSATAALGQISADSERCRLWMGTSCLGYS